MYGRTGSLRYGEKSYKRQEVVESHDRPGPEMTQPILSDTDISSENTFFLSILISWFILLSELSDKF